MSGKLTIKKLSRMIGHSLFHPAMTDDEITAGCQLANKYDIAAVCVKPRHLSITAGLLNNTDIRVCTVVGFPHGKSAVTIHSEETENAILSGASEIDLVINISKVISGEWSGIEKEIDHINKITVFNGAVLKVILENEYLTDEQIIHLCEICSKINVAFIGISAGFGFVKPEKELHRYKDALDHRLGLMHRYLHPDVQIKVTGGVCTFEDLLRVRSLGVTRVGTTDTQAILEEAQRRLDGFIA